MQRDYRGWNELMSITKFAVCITALAVVLAASPALGQREIRHFPPLVDPDGYNPDVYQPFLEPDIFDGDLQFFAPAQFSEFGGGEDNNIGWFGSYDRVYLWMTRPEDQLAGGPSQASQVSLEQADHKSGDFTWGNRFDVGYMTGEDHGWLASFWHIDGPNFFDVLEIERIDVFDALDQVNSDPATSQDLRTGGGAGAANMGLLGQPARDANDPITGARDFRRQNSVNAADLSSFEFNKTFRIRPLHYKSVVEPFFGFRYMKFSDFYARDGYERFNNVTGAPLGTGIVVGGTEQTFTIEDLTRIRARFDNHMVGGQLGVRWFKRKQKWNLSSELRAFAAQNFQSIEGSTNIERTYFGAAPGTDAMINTVVFDQVRSAGHTSEFVIGTEVRAEAAYAVTRDFSLRAGMAFMHLGRGIGRGNTLARNNQTVTIIGATFGAELRR